MKSFPNTQPNPRKFPLVDYHYHASMLNGSSAPCLQTSKSLRDITRDYFDAEADREFISEAAVYAHRAHWHGNHADCDRDIRDAPTATAGFLCSDPNETVIPDRKPTDQTIVRPAGFAPNLSSMDVPRAGVAKETPETHHYHRGFRPGADPCHDSNFAIETGRAEHRSFDGLDRYR